MILIGTDEGIYRWVEGSGWPAYHSLQDRKIVGLDSFENSTLVVLDSLGNILESLDGGQAWRVLSRPPGAGRTTSVVIDGSPPAIVAAHRPIGLSRRFLGVPNPRSVDQGVSPTVTPRLKQSVQAWTRGAAAALATRRAASLTAPADDQSGAWARLPCPQAPKEPLGNEIRSIARLPGEEDIWLASVSGAGLWVSPDGGASWNRAPDLPDEILGVRADASRPGSAWISTDKGIWRTADGAATWSSRSAGLEQAMLVRAIDWNPKNPKKLLAGCGSSDANARRAPDKEGLGFALYESNDEGQSWSKVKGNFPGNLEFDTISDIRHDPSDPDNVLVALGSGEVWATRNGGFYWGPLSRQFRAARVLCAVG